MTLKELIKASREAKVADKIPVYYSLIVKIYERIMSLSLREIRKEAAKKGATNRCCISLLLIMAMGI
jgi:hypothetical protein